MAFPLEHFSSFCSHIGIRSQQIFPNISSPRSQGIRGRCCWNHSVGPPSTLPVQLLMVRYFNRQFAATSADQHSSVCKRISSKAPPTPPQNHHCACEFLPRLRTAVRITTTRDTCVSIYLGGDIRVTSVT